MPLAFPSINHGEVAFGFFNIDVDMLLLEHYFLFADQFCESVAKLARVEDSVDAKDTWTIHDIQPPEAVGDLMGAIHGVRHTGFIGAVYRRFPFPARQIDFKQKPSGYQNRDVILALIDKYAVKKPLPVVVKEADRIVGIGDYLFTFDTFQELVRYVWQGGYPRWKNEERPGYVSALREILQTSRRPVFNTLEL